MKRQLYTLSCPILSLTEDGQADLRRYHCKPRRTSSYPRRQSKRLRNQERQKQGLFGLSLSSSSSEDDESENNDRDRQGNRG